MRINKNEKKKKEIVLAVANGPPKFLVLAKS